jgi:transcription elongation GreA/GreB family factor
MQTWPYEWPGFLVPMISKSKVLQSCHRLLAEKRSRLQREVLEIREAAARETKSSAGDKYETTREMMLAEAERLSNRLQEMERMEEMVYQAGQAHSANEITLGSLVQTDKNVYFLAASLGCLTIDGIPVFVISAASPIGKLLLAKAVNDRFEWNGQMQQIIQILD